MPDRGRLFYASDGLLWEVDPTASISGEPAQADLQPVRMGEMAAEVMELDQQADDGTDRVFIRGSDGAIKAEVFFDGTNTVINPLTGSVDVQGALATGQLNTGQGIVWDRDGAADIVDRWTLGLTSDPSQRSNTAYADVANAVGFAVDFSKAPSGATLYGRVIQRFSSNHASDSASTRVQLVDTSGSASNLTEIEQTVTNTGFPIKDTGWTEITTISSGVYAGAALQAKTSTTNANYEVSMNPGPAIVFGWRLD